jgi:DNA repair protein RecO (recombination protein O)
MQLEHNAIILKTTKYQDKNLIVKAYSLQQGLITFYVQSVFSSPKKASKYAYFQPLNIVDFQLNHHKIGSLPKLKTINNRFLLQDIYTKIEKSSVVIFLAELINLCIKEEEKNEQMYFFLENKILELEKKYHGNFHLIFLLEFTAYLGFFPKKNYQIGNYFNKQEGSFTTHFNPFCFSELQSSQLHVFFENPFKIYNSSQKNDILNLLIEYYQNHIDSHFRLKSLEVLREIFSY